ncbi:hypothetical protein AGMMS49525_09210 [Bacteroidia bacterium]|nr:hypothetical protein AGMMS49525_09210 [Bacteroidia bacterium]
MGGGKFFCLVEPAQARLRVRALYPALRFARALKKSLFYTFTPFTDSVEGVKLDFEGFFSALRFACMGLSKYNAFRRSVQEEGSFAWGVSAAGLRPCGDKTEPFF